MSKWDELISRLGRVRPTKKAQRLYDDAVGSGIFIDHAKALYGPDPANHLAVEFGRSVRDADVEALQALIYQRSQERLSRGPEMLEMFRGDRHARSPEEVLSFSMSPHVANRYARGASPSQPPGTVGRYAVPRQAVLADAQLSPGTFAEEEILARLLDSQLLQALPYRPPQFP